MSVTPEASRPLLTHWKLEWEKVVKYDKKVTEGVWQDPVETMRKEGRYLLLQAELGILAVATACAALGRDRLSPSVPTGGTEGLGGQPTEVSPDLYASADPASWDRFYDGFFGVNVNVPSVSEELQIKGDPTYSSLRAVRVQATDLELDFFIAQKPDGSTESFPVRWFQDAKTGEMVAYQMQVGQDSAGRNVISNYQYDSQGNYVIAARGILISNAIDVQKIRLPGEENYIDISALGSLILGLDPGLANVAAAASTSTPEPTRIIRLTDTSTPSPTDTPTAEVISEAERLGLPVGKNTWDQVAQRAAVEKYFLNKYPGKTWEDAPELLDVALNKSEKITGARRGTFSAGAGYLDPEYNGPDGNVVDAQYLGSYRSSLEGVALGDGTVGKKGDWFVNALYAIPRNGFNTEIDGLVFKNVDIIPAAVSAEVNGKFVVVMLAESRGDLSPFGSSPSSLWSLTHALKWMDDGESLTAPHWLEVSTRFASKDKIGGYISYATEETRPSPLFDEGINGGALFMAVSYLWENSDGSYYPGIWDVLDQVRSSPEGVGRFGVFVIEKQGRPASSQ